MQSSFGPYAGHFGDDFESVLWGRSHRFPQPTPSAQQGYHHHGFSTQGPSNIPPAQDNELNNMLEQLLQGQTDYALEMNQQVDQLKTKLDAWVTPQENKKSISSTSRPQGTLTMHQNMDPKECYNEWSVVDNTTQAEQEDAYDAIENEFELELEHLFLDFNEASTSPKVQHTTLNVDIKELSEGDELKKFEMRVVNKEKREAPFKKKE